MIRKVPVTKRETCPRRKSAGVGVIAMRSAMAVCVVAALVSFPPAAGGQGLQTGADVSLNDGVPREVENVTVEQNLGAQVPLNLPLTDSKGRKVKTGYFIDGNMPTIISLNYSDCPMLCNVQLNQLAKSLGELDLQAGKDFQMLSVSIDPKESVATSAATKQKYVDQLINKHPDIAEGWEFCTAQQPIITKLADVLGFKYTYDRKSGEYYHPAMLAFVSPKGIVTRYSLAVVFEPEDLRKAIIEAGDGTVGSPVDQLILWCFSYDPDSNSYVPQAWKIMRLAGAATIGLMIACLAPYWVGRKGNAAVDSDAVDSDEDDNEPGSRSDAPI